MFKLDSRLTFVISVFGLLMVVLSCSQTDDIIAPKSLTKIWLSVERLPTPTEGMIYGLWASKVAYPDISGASQVRSLGRFSYFTSDTLVAFIDENGTVRADSNEFALDGDLFEFDYLFVTVELEGTNNALPGPVMLLESVTGNTDTLRLYFPQHDSLFDAIVRCNFESPTDGNRWNDGYGLWFCNYGTVRRVIRDTLSVTVTYVWDTIYAETNQAGETINFASLYAQLPDTVWFDFDTVRLDFGRDTLALSIDSFIHYGAKRHVVYEVDSTIPRIVKEYSVSVVTNDVAVDLDVFSQDLYSLPDLSPYGWMYKGWVVANHIPKVAVGEFTPPAWDFTTGELLIPGYQGGLMTTGTFTDETDFDNSNPFTLEIPWDVDSLRIDTVSTNPLVTDSTYEQYTVLKRPRFPGEDFLDTAALSQATNGKIVPPLNNVLLGGTTSSGSVFVTVEPVNMPTDTTNFPLIAFCRNLPSGATNIWTLQSWVGSASGARGFPKVTAEIKRY